MVTFPRRRLWRRAIRTPPRVIAYRGFQELRIHALRVTGGWRRIAHRAEEFWTEQRLRTLLASDRSAVIVEPTAAEALREMAARDGDRRGSVRERASQILRREFTILGAPLPERGAWPWHEDWRWDRRWPAQFFRGYDPYEARDEPFDVKVPWELSRLSFLPPVIQAAILEDDVGLRRQAVAILADWEAENPLAYSVNWHPMEASMRAIQLTIVLGMLRAVEDVDSAKWRPLARLLVTHGEFIWRTVEFSAVRGNHFMANVVALLVLGLSLQDAYPPAGRWAEFGMRHFPRECEQQFHPDGVNFEGSIPYHRFMTELVLVGLLALRRRGTTLAEPLQRRIHAACSYVALCQRPDGLLPNVGDNDDAVVLTWDEVAPRNPGPMLAVAAILFRDASLCNHTDAPLAVTWMLGQPGLREWAELPVEPVTDTCLHLQCAGVVVAKTGSSYLWMDVGAVGTRGRGGHGHNDLGSFELSLGGSNLIIDPGCPVYSGDPALRNSFRSTAAHNIAEVDGCEIAPLVGLWEVQDVARPLNVSVTSDTNGLSVRVDHEGYCRLPDPVTVRRRVRFDPHRELLVCRDVIVAERCHSVRRRVHFDPGVAVSIRKGGAVLSSGGREWVLRWNASAAVEFRATTVSSGYGCVEPTHALVLSDFVEGDHELFFEISPAVIDDSSAVDCVADDAKVRRE